jgi:uncharacterized protein
MNAIGYLGRTTHERLAPFRRRFSYRVFTLYLDVDHIADAARGILLLSHNRFNLFSFRDKDHGDRSGAGLRPWAEAAFASAGLDMEGGAIRLLCFPRILGYAFKPLSVFFGFGPDGALRGIIYEVNNTFGETHSYVAPANAGARLRHVAAKAFHVSPFLDVRGDYHFLVGAPEEAMSLTVRNVVDGESEHIATLTGKRVAVTDWRLLAVFASLPFMTLKVIAAIHWQALFIWARGARYRPKPPPPAQAFSRAFPQDAPKLS